MTVADTSNNSEKISEVKQTADKISWLVKSGDSASNMALTDNALTVIANGIDLTGRVTFNALDTSAQNKINGIESTANTANNTANTANNTANTANNQINAWKYTDKTTINGGMIETNTITANQIASNAITANHISATAIDGKTIKGANIIGATINNSTENPTFSVSALGNMKIGGLTGHIINGYERGQFEVTSSGTLYSVSPDNDGAYTKLEEGKIYCYNGSNSTTINGSTITADDLNILSISNRNGQGVEIHGGDYGVYMRTSSGAGYFDPMSNSNVRLGSTSALWKVAYVVEGVKNSSDRTCKENIQYLHYDNMNNQARTTNDISTSSCLDFIANDYLLTTYSYINDKDKKTRLSAIAQDILVDDQGNDNVIGQLIVDVEESASNNSILTMNQTQLLNVAIGAIQELSKQVEELKQRLGEDK
jgi:hypothetical protein